jgi:hypothetical protein
LTVPGESAFVFNIVWTGRVFPWLQYLVASQIDRCDARFRFVANGCPPDQLDLMERFAGRSRGRVVEVLEASATMERHGTALDRTLLTRDDGDYFCFIDPDIAATGPFLGDFVEALESGCSAVTSGKGVWNDDVTVPPGHLGVPGECFYSPDGFLFGSPHFAIYRKGPLLETIERWGVGFGSAGPDIPDDAKERLEAAGHHYWLYDTGKIVNILLQDGGGTLCHFEHAALLHIGGMSHYLSPPEYEGDVDAANAEPDRTKWPWPAERLAVARYTASLLRDLAARRPEPPMPQGLDDALQQKLATVREAIVEVVGTYSPFVREAGTAVW